MKWFLSKEDKAALEVGRYELQFKKLQDEHFKKLQSEIINTLSKNLPVTEVGDLMFGDHQDMDDETVKLAALFNSVNRLDDLERVMDGLADYRKELNGLYDICSRQQAMINQITYRLGISVDNKPIQDILKEFGG